MLPQLKNILKNEIDPAFACRAEFILKAVEKQKPKKILDAGCGRGFYLKALSLYQFPKEIHGIDINDNYLKIARKISDDKRIIIKRSSIYSLPYQKHYFDFVIASEILEHLTDDLKALAEIKRVLKPNGLLAITIPNYNFPFLWDPINWILMNFFNTHINKKIWWLAGIWADHERLYDIDKLKKLMSKTGFKIKKIEKTIHWCWPFSHFLLYGLGKNLVERFNLNQFNRFFVQKKKIFSLVLARLFSLPSNLLDKKIKIKNNPSVGICILASSQ